ncbi:MAG: hypothetical protein AAAFM81_03155 [Pseudomonadota bacterium]
MGEFAAAILLVVVALVGFFLFAVLPVKVAGQLLGAKRKGMLPASIAVLLSLPLAYLASDVLGLGVSGVYLVYAATIYFTMRPSVLGALLIPLLSTIILFAVLWLAGHFGLIDFNADISFV